MHHGGCRPTITVGGRMAPQHGGRRADYYGGVWGADAPPREKVYTCSLPARAKLSHWDVYFLDVLSLDLGNQSL